MGETDTPQGDIQTPAVEEGQTPEQDLTHTQKQVDAIEAKARSDERADVGRLKKAAEESNRIAQSALKRLQEREDADLAREEEAVKDDPDKFSALRLKRDALRIKAEVEDKMQIVEQKETDIQTQREVIQKHSAEMLAEKYSVTSDTLLRFGADGMEELAKSFGERIPGESLVRVTTPPDTGKTKGGTPSGRKPTLEEVKAVSAEVYMANIQSGEWVIM